MWRLHLSLFFLLYPVQTQNNQQKEILLQVMIFYSCISSYFLFIVPDFIKPFIIYLLLAIHYSPLLHCPTLLFLLSSSITFFNLACASFFRSAFMLLSIILWNVAFALK